MHAAGRAALARASGAGLGRLLGSRGLQQAAAHCGAAAGASSEAPVLVVEYCVLCNYKPRFDVLKTRVEREFPGLQVREDIEDHRPASFEVSLHQGTYVTDLWSKLTTGEPSNVEATEAVAELVVRDLRRLLPRPAAPASGAN